MRRFAFKMRLKPGVIEEYQRRHQDLWPELAALLRAGGVRDYSIFYDPETLTLFAVQKVDGEGSSQALGQEAVVKRWWAYMAPLMETNADLSPVSVPLAEVFHLD